MHTPACGAGTYQTIKSPDTLLLAELALMLNGSQSGIHLFLKTWLVPFHKQSSTVSAVDAISTSLQRSNLLLSRNWRGESPALILFVTYDQANTR